MRTPTEGRVSPAELDAAAAAWTVFSTAYGRLPEAGFVDALRSAEQLAQWPYADRESAAGIDLLVRSGRRAAGGEPEEQLGALVDDHRRLFIGPRPLLAAPWESVYRSREGLVFDVQTIQVRQAYRRFGLESPYLNKEPDDHIALESSFVATLAVRALDAFDALDVHDTHDTLDAHGTLDGGAADGDGPGVEELVGAMSAFARDHLGAWLPDFLERIEEHAATDYHRGMARLTSGALDQLLAVGA